jgi:large subunit ribosomal protein L30
VASKELKVTLTKMRRTHHTVTVIDTPENRGMINKISYMLSVEEA